MLGPNGAGKTTLLNIMLDLLNEDEGKIMLFGRDVHKDRDFIIQVNSMSIDAKFHWLLTPKEVLNLYAKFYGLSDERRKSKIKELSELFGIKDFMNKQIRWLSTGQEMRLSMAKSLINDPELLLLDEPTIGLDPDIAIKTRELIKEINKERGTTILLTSLYE